MALDQTFEFNIRTQEGGTAELLAHVQVSASHIVVDMQGNYEVSGGTIDDENGNVLTVLGDRLGYDTAWFSFVERHEDGTVEPVSQVTYARLPEYAHFFISDRGFPEQRPQVPPPLPPLPRDALIAYRDAINEILGE